jgi:hypothetical protein
MKNAIMLAMFLIGIIKLNAQESVEKHQVKINFLLPSISYERALSSKSTLYSEFGTSFGIYGPIFEGVAVIPFLNEEFRYYYNLEKRSANGKRILGNSGSFLAINAIYNFRSLNTGATLTSQSADFAIVPNWGFQHTGKKGFSTGLNLGYGYGFSENGNHKFVMIKLSLGWILKGKK